MSEFPGNPEDVSAQMGQSLAQKLNDAGVLPSMNYGSPTSIMVPRVNLVWHGPRPVASLWPGPEAEIDIFNVDRHGRVDDSTPYEDVPLGEFGINNIEVTKNPGTTDRFGPGAWDIVAMGSTGKAAWDEFGPDWVDVG